MAPTSAPTWLVQTPTYTPPSPSSSSHSGTQTLSTVHPSEWKSTFLTPLTSLFSSSSSSSGKKAAQKKTYEVVAHPAWLYGGELSTSSSSRPQLSRRKAYVPYAAPSEPAQERKYGTEELMAELAATMNELAKEEEQDGQRSPPPPYAAVIA